MPERGLPVSLSVTGCTPDFSLPAVPSSVSSGYGPYRLLVNH